MVEKIGLFFSKYWAFLIKRNRKWFLLIIVLMGTFCFLLFSFFKESTTIPISDVWKHVDYQNKKGAIKVVEKYRKVLNTNPNSPEAYYLLSRCINKESDKIKILLEGESKDPNNPYILSGLGAFYINASNSRDLYKSREYSEKAIIYDSTNPLALYNLYYYYKTKAENEKSLEVLQASYSAELKFLNALLSSPFRDHLNDFDDNKIKYLISNVKEELQKVKERLSECRGHENQLRAFEVSRISKFSYVLIYELSTYYIGDCKYKSIGKVIDQMHGNVVDINITYLYNAGEWLNADEYR